MPKTNPFVVLWTRFFTSWLAANLSVCRCFCGHSKAANRLSQKEWSESACWRMCQACVIAFYQAQGVTSFAASVVCGSRDKNHTRREGRPCVHSRRNNSH